jgi:transcriptional regulator with XRE-family HTH domain
MPENKRVARGRGDTSAGPPRDFPAVRIRTANVKVLMNAAGWTMAELSRNADIDQGTVSKIFSGDLRLGQRSIAGLHQAFTERFPTIGFYDLFEVLNTNGREVKPQVDILNEITMDGAIAKTG